MDSLAELTEQLRRFAAERAWESFHTPKNLAMALAGELPAELRGSLTRRLMSCCI